MTRIQATLTGSLALLLLASGCSSIPKAQAPPPAPLDTEPLPYRVAVAPVRVELATEEEPKEYRATEVVDPEEAAAQLRRWIESSGVFSRIRPMRGLAASGARPLLDDAWENRDDLLLEIALVRFRTNFDGHNGWWIPNIINWLFWLVPAWFVATEDYSLEFTTELRLTSVGSGQLLHSELLKVRVEGSFDEFDRGWQFFGFIYPLNDADNWRLIAERMLPAALSEAGAQLLEELRGPTREKLGREGIDRQLSKTLALCVGVSHYQDSIKLPPLPHAAQDARGMARTLRASSRLADRQIREVIGGDASRGGVEKALAELAERATSFDQVLLYFACYGTRTRKGEAVLVLNALEGYSSMSLSQLAELLARIPGRKLVILDCAFDGQARSISSKRRPRGGAQAELDSFAKASGAAVLLASAPGSDLLSPEHLGAGLFAYQLELGLSGQADRDQSGSVSHVELYDFARERTVAESAYFGKSQRPLSAGMTALEFSLETPPTQGAKQ